MKKGWKKIGDDKIVTVFKSTCNCPDAVCEVELKPCDFTEVGIPMCQECGVNFEYVETRIKAK